MKPLSLSALFACVFVLLLSALVFIVRLLGWLEVNWFVLLCAGATPCVTIFFLIYNYFKKPFIKEFYKEDWICLSDNRKDIFIPLPAKTHKQGRRPIIEFIEMRSPYASKLVEPIVADNGDIKFIHPENHFLPYAPKEFKVRIVAN